MQLISCGFNNKITAGKIRGRFPERQKSLKDSECGGFGVSPVGSEDCHGEGERTEMLSSVRGHHSHGSDLVSELTVSSRKHF